MKNGASLLKNLTRFDRHSKMCLAQIDTESGETLKSGDMENLTRTSRQIARVQLNMMKLARELEAVSNQIRAAVLGATRCVAMPTPASAGTHSANGSNPKGSHPAQRFAFAAVRTENGAVIARVWEETYGIWPQLEYGCFETWTQAQEFATVLNQSYGIDAIEAQHIVISSSLAGKSSQQT